METKKKDKWKKKSNEREWKKKLKWEKIMIQLSSKTVIVINDLNILSLHFNYFLFLVLLHSFFDSAKSFCFFFLHYYFLMVRNTFINWSKCSKQHQQKHQLSFTMLKRRREKKTQQKNWKTFTEKSLRRRKKNYFTSLQLSSKWHNWSGATAKTDRMG